MWRVRFSGGEVKWHGFDGLREGFPAVDLSHLDLAGGEQRPEQHRHGIGAGQHGLGLDAAAELLVQALNETPALMRRTLDWLSTSLSKGMSRDGDRVTFWAVFPIRSSPRRAPEATLPISLTVALQAPNLSLFEVGSMFTGVYMDQERAMFTRVYIKQWSYAALTPRCSL